jgi:hypothetical protein
VQPEVALRNLKTKSPLYIHWLSEAIRMLMNHEFRLGQKDQGRREWHSGS